TDTGTCGRTRSRTRSSRRCRRLASRSGASRSTWRSPTHQVPVPAPSATGRTSGPGAWPAPLSSSLRRVRISRRTVSAVGVGAWVMVAPLSFGGRCGGIGASVHYDHVPGGVVEPPSAVPGDGHDVLDADAEPAGQVDAGFDGEAHARHERLLLALDHVGRLVRGDADAVPGAVDEVLAVAGVGDDRAGRPVDVLAGGAGAHGAESGLLGGAYEVVDAALLVGGLPDVHGAGGVGAVAVLQAAEVEDDHVAVGDDAVAGLVVRVGAVGAGGDDGEVHAGVPVPQQQRGEVGGDVGLPAPGEGHRADLL